MSIVTRTLMAGDYAWPDPRAPSLSGEKSAAVLRSQLLRSPSSSSSSSSSSPCKPCTALGRITCAHLSARQCAALQARRMRVQRRAAAPRQEPMQVYACPGRHAYEGATALGGRAIGARARTWAGVRELLPGMCPACWSEALNDGFRGGRRRWTHEAVTMKRKEPRRSKAGVRERMEELLLLRLCGGGGGGGGDGAPNVVEQKGKKGIGAKAEKCWRLSKVEEGKLR